MIFCENNECEYSVDVPSSSVVDGELRYLNRDKPYYIKHYPYKSVTTNKILFLCEVCKTALDIIRKHNLPIQQTDRQ